ncbi:MAG: EF-hand domain-containing protein [Verrucomicrobiaceae bacterium]
MKSTITTLSLVLASALIAHAEPGDKKEKGPRGGRPLPPEVVAKFDKDGDGKLSEEERKAAFEARKAEMLAKFDKDGDGKLSDEEKEAAREAQKAEFIKKFDKDGDGKVSAEERPKRPGGADRPGPGGEKGKGKGPKGGKGKGKKAE